MYENADSKLEDARHNFESLRAARDSIAFKAAFNSFLGNCRSVTYALQKQGVNFAGFSDWYTIKQNEMKNDELLRFIHEARTDDFHEGKHCLRFSTHNIAISDEAVGPPPQEGASLCIGSQGPFWLLDEGTPQQRRIPVIEGSCHAISVSIDNPPSRHMGKGLDVNDPITLAQLALRYMEQLIFDAKQITLEACQSKSKNT